ncbi:phage tail sheath C-terminal domain-containing protein [Streptomyces ossamyceticus]|nr:phage tail sheath C-terminal domain-containing protein [Streptomyces ossamyceticus]
MPGRTAGRRGHRPVALGGHRERGVEGRGEPRLEGRPASGPGDQRGRAGRRQAGELPGRLPRQGRPGAGARTLDTTDNTWRYIPVRRLADAVQRDLQRALTALASEPNTQPTWEKLRAAADTYLHGIWQQGGLRGHSPQEAYSVQIGQDTTMTETDVKAGKVVMKVSLAVARPGEFSPLTLTGTLRRA